MSKKRYDRAATNYQRAIYLTEEADLKHPSLGALYLELGQAYRGQGDLENAEAFMRKALAFSEEHLAVDAEAVRTVVGNLATVLDKRDKVEDAEAFYLREIKMMDQGMRKHHLYHVWIAYPLADLADLYRRQGKTGDAEHFFKRALSVMDDVKLNDSAVPSVMENYAKLLRQLDRLDEAIQIEGRAEAYRRSLAKPGS